MSEDDFDDILKAVMKASMIVFALMAASRFLGYVFNILIAKSFSGQVYGSYALLWSVVTLSASILLLGIPWGAARFIAYYRGRKEKDNVADTLKTGLVMTVILVVASSAVIYALLSRFAGFFSVGGMAVTYTVLLFASFAFFTYFYQAITGFRKPEVSNLVELTAKVIAVLGLYAIVLSKLQFASALLVLAIAYASAAVAGFCYCAKKYDLGGRVRGDLSRIMAGFGFSIMISNVSYGILTWADVFMIRAFKSLSDVGVYYAANLTSTAGLMFFGSVTLVFTPIITEYFGEKKFDKMSRLSSYVLESFFVLFTPVFLVFLAFPREILTLLFRGEYAQGALAFQILVVAMFLFGVIQVFRSILQAVGKPQLEVRVVLFAAIVNVLLNLVLIKPYGIVGAAVATVIANIIILTATYYYATRIVRVHYSKKRVLKVALACVVALSVTSYIKAMVENPVSSLLASGVTLGAVYIALLYTLKSFRREDVFALDAVLRKINFPDQMRQKLVECMKNGVPKK